jgi:hypothetical protein
VKNTKALYPIILDDYQQSHALMFGAQLTKKLGKCEEWYLRHWLTIYKVDASHPLAGSTAVWQAQLLFSLLRYS